MEVLACRVCLVTDTNLLSLCEEDILSIFEDVVGVSLSQNNVLPKQICELCKDRLLGFASFKKWCQNTQALLNAKLAADSFIPKEFMRDINKTFPRTNLSAAKLLEVHINDDALKEEMLPLLKNDVTNSYEHETKSEDNYEQYEVLDEDLIDDYETEVTDMIKIEIEEARSYEEEDTSYEELDKNENLYQNPNTVQEKNEKSQLSNCFVEVDCGKIVNASCATEKNTVQKDGSTKISVVRKETEKVKPIKRLFKKKINVKRAKWPQRSKYMEWLEVLKAMTEENLKNYDMKLNRVLTKEEQISKMLARKDTDMYKTSLFKCESCCKGFMSEKAFKTHALTHRPSSKRPVECPLCHVYLGARSMKAHERHHRLELVCLRCGDCVDARKAKTHYDYHQGVKYECKDCSKTFIHDSTYRNHKRIHHADAACAICGELYNGRNGVVVHVRKSHSEEANAQCETCEHYFCTKEALQRHLEDCNSNYSPCGWCGVSFPTVTELAFHIPREHSTKKYTESHYCTECSSSFSSEVKLAGHWRRLHHDRSRAAIGAGLGTSPKLNVDKPKAAAKEKKTTQKVLPTICDQCGIKTNYLPTHMLRHTGERPHQCPYCDKSFRIKQSLLNHIMIHNGVKPFNCSECGNTFRQSSHLIRHMRIHTGEKPFSCAYCLKAFSLKENRDEHARTVHEGAPPRRRNRRGKRRATATAGGGLPPA